MQWQLRHLRRQLKPLRRQLRHLRRQLRHLSSWRGECRDTYPQSLLEFMSLHNPVRFVHQIPNPYHLLFPGSTQPKVVVTDSLLIINKNVVPRPHKSIFVKYHKKLSWQDAYEARILGLSRNMWVMDSLLGKGEKSKPFSYKATVYTQVGYIVRSGFYPPLSPLGKQGGFIRKKKNL